MGDGSFGTKLATLAVVVARSQSKGVPGKNIRLLAGVPLLHYSIWAAQRSCQVERIFVSTDGQDVAEVARLAGAEVIIRPSEYARDDSPVLLAVRHVLEVLKSRGEPIPADVVVLQPTSPLRDGNTIDKAINLLRSSGCDSVMGVSRTSNKLCTISSEGFLEFTYPEGAQRQQMKGFYYDQGHIYVCRSENILRGTLTGKRVLPFIVDRIAGLDIDDPLDFELAGLYLNHYRHRFGGKDMKSISIGDKKIGQGLPPFIIAEAGINHNGVLEDAKLLVEEAAKAGADAIKFQTHLPDKEMLRDEKGADYIGESFYQLLDRTKLSFDDHRLLKAFAEQRGIIFLSTPFSREAADFLENLGVAAFKIGSGELTNTPLLKHIARKGKPMIISTGMSELDEVAETVKEILPLNDNIMLMQCTSTYPTAYKNVNLKIIPQLKEKFRVPVGLSDHSEGIFTALGAVALGANVLEKHFTIDRNWPGPDQKASIEPRELAELVRGSQAIFLASGQLKEVLPEERQVQDMARESVVSICDIPEGTLLNEKNIWVKRPGTGIPARELHKVLGKRALKDIPRDTLIQWDQIA